MTYLFNKMFSLYRNSELIEFENTKANDKECFVYVPQGPPAGKNILSAQMYGHLVFLEPEKSNLIYSPQPYVRKMKKFLKDYKEGDYILCMGDPAMIGITTAIALDANQGKASLLKWDRQEARYYSVSIDIRNNHTQEPMSEVKPEDRNLAYIKKHF